MRSSPWRLDRPAGAGVGSRAATQNGGTVLDATRYNQHNARAREENRSPGDPTIDSLLDTQGELLTRIMDGRDLRRLHPDYPVWQLKDQSGAGCLFQIVLSVFSLIGFLFLWSRWIGTLLAWIVERIRKLITRDERTPYDERRVSLLRQVLAEFPEVYLYYEEIPALWELRGRWQRAVKGTWGTPAWLVPADVDPEQLNRRLLDKGGWLLYAADAPRTVRRPRKPSPKNLTQLLRDQSIPLLIHAAYKNDPWTVAISLPT